MKFIENHKKALLIVLIIVSLSFITIGFALYQQTLEFAGTVTLIPDGKIYISDVTTVSLTHAAASPEYTDTSVDFNLTFTTQRNVNLDDYRAEFTVTITNDSSYDFVYTSLDNTHTIRRQSNNATIDPSAVAVTVNGIQSGDKIPSKTSKTLTVIYNFINPSENYYDTFIIDGAFVPTVTEDKTATLMASINNISTPGDLRGNIENTKFTMTVTNSYNVPKTFSIDVLSDIFVTKSDTLSESIQYTIAANSSDTFDFYISKVPGAKYYISPARVDVVIRPTDNENYINAGRVSILVDQNASYNDTEPPLISGVTAEILNAKNNVYVGWTGKDDLNIDHYTVIAYQVGSNGSATEYKRYNTPDDISHITLTDIPEGNFYFTVFGTDSSGNTATSSQISSATTDENYACRSQTLENLKWVFSVTFNLTNATKSNAASTVNRGDTYTATISGSGDYSRPTTLTVTMGGVETTAFNYDYDNTGAFSISNVTGNLVITGSGRRTCLIKGTKILLANGTYKNIENITYSDLLTVYDHVNGRLTNVYPIWIEEKNKSNIYEKITFSDGSTLGVVCSHSLFDVDKKMYVDVSKPDQFGIGSRVYKVINGDLQTVTVTNIEYIHEDVEYYNVVSTKYYNVIANDLLTTDTTSSISNIYGFKDNAIYSDNYNLISNGSKLEYSSVPFIPHYLYKGLNLQNAKSLLGSSLDISFLSRFIEAKTLSIPERNGHKLFMVTTSSDISNNNNNVENYLYEEGSVYTFPSVGAKYFVDTSTGLKYKEGDTFIVENSTHFDIIW